MRSGSTRLNVTLDEEYAVKLARLAEQTHVQEGTLARSLLSRAIDEADLHAETVVQVLDGIRVRSNGRSWGSSTLGRVVRRRSASCSA